MNKDRISLSTSPLHGIERNLLEAQFKSYLWLKEEGLKRLFDEISPIEDYTGKSWEISFGNIRFGEPSTNFKTALKKGATLDIPVFIKVSLTNKKTKEIKEQEIYLMDLPIMSERGTFVVSGNERSIVQQIVRSEGILMVETKNETIPLYGVKIIPQYGKWYTFETNKQGVMTVKLLDGRPRIHLTTILKALGYSIDEIQKLFKDADTGEINFTEATLAKDKTKSTEDAIIKIFQTLRPEDSLSLEAAKAFFHSLFFSKRRFYLGKVGRYQISKKLYGKKLQYSEISENDCLLNKHDIVSIIKALIELNNGIREIDDADHLSNRRIRGVGELIQEDIRRGVLRMEKNLKDKMGTFSTEELVTPSMMVNTRPVSAAITQFFGSSEISRYMDQQNILSEIEAKRRITAGGPGGLTTESATISVRDIHYSHYSRIDPVETPEGPQVGIVSHMALYARVNDFGILEAPYRKVISGEELLNSKIKIKDLNEKDIDKKKMYVTDEIVYLDPDEEYNEIIAPADIKIFQNREIEDNYVFCRTHGNYANVAVNKINYIDVVTMQIAGASLSLVPFIMNDDSNRALMAANMQRQAVPLLKAESAIVGTGTERIVAEASGRAIFAETSGVVKYADAGKLLVSYDKPVRSYKTEKTTKLLKNQLQESDTDVLYELTKFQGSNQNTCFDQQLVVKMGDKFKKGEVLVQGPSMQNDEIALGTNLIAAYIPWYGFSYEDGIVLSERVVKDDLLTSIHIKEYVQDIRETKLGNEEMTKDIPNISEFALRNLDEDGLVRNGSYVNSGDILVGIVAPKGEVEMSAEEKLLRVIFGEASKDVRDNSLRLPHGDKGVVIDVQVLDRNKGDKLSPGVLKQVKVYVARTHKIGVGDKLTGRHGDKGIVTKILPVEDMPFLEDGTPVDIVLNTLSIIKRMNLGQLHETHVGYVASKIGKKLAVPPFAPINTEEIYNAAKKEGFDTVEKVKLFDGRTGEAFDNDIVVGIRYMMKLDHLAEDKVHARSVGAYTIVTQQPLGGKAQFGGQRFGEMEVWALEAHAVPYLLHETLTTRSDDVISRVMAYRAILNGTPIPESNTTASFEVLQKELASLNLKLETIGAVENKVDADELVVTGGLLDNESTQVTESEKVAAEEDKLSLKEEKEMEEAL